MNNLGIIAEYNPFHNGHLYHLKASQKLGQAEHVIAVMSGDFTQRGEPALYDKWIRAEMAVKNGVDLVIELPFVFACNSAEFFAAGAMGILNRLGCVTHFSFGSESGDLSELLKAAERLTWETEEFKSALKFFLDQGFSFPRARFEAMKEVEGEETGRLLRDPNNILAVEYLKQWILTGRRMEPLTIKRAGKGYHDRDTDHPLASATAIRQRVGEARPVEEFKDTVPEATADSMKGENRAPVTDSEGLFPLLVYKILTSPREELAEILSVGEGLENKLKQAVGKSKTTEELIDAVVSKRYTKTRIRRLLLHTLTNLTKEEFFRLLSEPPLYVRVLGFSEKGAKLLRHIKKKECSSIPIISNMNKEVRQDDPIWALLRYDVLAADLYNLAFGRDLYSYSDYVCKPYC